MLQIKKIQEFQFSSPFKNFIRAKLKYSAPKKKEKEKKDKDKTKDKKKEKKKDKNKIEKSKIKEKKSEKKLKIKECFSIVSVHKSHGSKIPTVKLKIPGKAF